MRFLIKKQNTTSDEDIVIEKDGMEVVVDESSLELIKGSTIDYTQELIRSAFSVVNNPQSESACGCGSSFAVKNFEANPAVDWENYFLLISIHFLPNPNWGPCITEL